MNDMKMIMEIFGRFKKNQKVETPEVFGPGHPDWMDYTTMVSDAKSDIILKGLKSEGAFTDGGGLDPYRAQLIDTLMNMAMYADAKDLKIDLKLVINMVRRLINHLEGKEIRRPEDLQFAGTGTKDKNRDFTNQIFEPRPQDAADDES